MTSINQETYKRLAVYLNGINKNITALVINVILPISRLNILCN